MKLLRWIWHWYRQGMKIFLFAAVAAMVGATFAWPPALLAGILEEQIAPHSEMSLPLATTYLLLTTLSFAIWTSIFAFVFAEQLKSHPLGSAPFDWRSITGARNPDETTQPEPKSDAPQ